MFEAELRVIGDRILPCVLLDGMTRPIETTQGSWAEPGGWTACAGTGIHTGVRVNVTGQKRVNSERQIVADGDGNRLDPISTDRRYEPAHG